MTPRDSWIDEGMAVLGEQGAAGIRVDRIAARLGLTKGSFHHHFKGAGDFHHALWERYEAAAMATIDKATASAADLPAETVLMELPASFIFEPQTEAAMRGWALESDQARAVQARVDAARLDALVGLWQRILPDPQRARLAAQVPYLILVGASVAMPTPTDADLREVFGLLATLVPAVR